MNRERPISSIKKLIDGKASVVKLMLSLKEWLGDMPEGRRVYYQQLEEHYNKILWQDSFDHSSYHALLDCIIELSDGSEEVRMVT